MFNSLKNTVENLKRDKLCCLIFDEMAIEVGLQYNKKLDVIEVFEDYSGGQRMRSFAGHVLVFMLKSISRNWKQPIAYYFCGGTTSTTNLSKIITDIIRALHGIGLQVVATICDQGSTNQSSINTLCLKTQHANYKSFEINGHEIVPLYDPPHLLKGIRNNFLTKDVHFTIKEQGKVAKWKHIVQLYELDHGDEDTKIIPKLTDFHVYPHKIKKMKVSYCTQVFK